MTRVGIVAKSHLREATPHLIAVESWLAARGHDAVFETATAVRCGVASRRCDLATMPTRVMTPSYNDPSP